MILGWHKHIFETPVACSDGDIQLSGGRNGTVGLVQICIGNVWGTVCDDSWDATDAQVVCNQLGFAETSSLVHVDEVCHLQAIACWNIVL